MGDPQAIAWDEALGEEAHWERSAKNAGVQVHNGQALEWAALATDIGCMSLEEAQWMIRCMVKLGKKIEPSRRKPWAFSELIGYREDITRLLRERRVSTIINNKASQ